MGDRKYEGVTTPMSEKKSSTNDVEKGTDKLADMILMEKKSSTKDVDKCTDELEDMKQAVNTNFRKGLDHFEGQYSGSKRWFKLVIGLKKTFSKIHLEFYKELFKKNIEDKNIKVYKKFIAPFDI